MQSACWAPVGTPGGCVTTCATPLLPGLLARPPSTPPVRVMYIPCHRARLTCPPHPLAPTRHPTDLNIHRPEESLSGIRSESNNFSCLFLLSALLCISPLQWWKGFYHCNSRSAEDEAVPVPMKCPLVFLLLLCLSIAVWFLLSQVCFPITLPSSGESRTHRHLTPNLAWHNAQHIPTGQSLVLLPYFQILQAMRSSTACHMYRS